MAASSASASSQLTRISERSIGRHTDAPRAAARPRAVQSAAAVPAASEPAGQSSERQTQEVVDALKEIRKAIEAPQGGFPEIRDVG